jgi:hypothetical protein
LIELELTAEMLHDGPLHDVVRSKRRFVFWNGTEVRRGAGLFLAQGFQNAFPQLRGGYALCTMCIGVGQGIAVVIERV